MDDWVMARLAETPVGRLATTSRDGVVHLVPVCFALLDGRAVSVVDHKPKRTVRLTRLQDMRDTGRAVLLVDHYSDDWSELWWIRVTGVATVHDPADAVDGPARAALAAKYHQYREFPPAGTVWSVSLDEVTAWSATPDRPQAPG